MLATTRGELYEAERRQAEAAIDVDPDTVDLLLEAGEPPLPWEPIDWSTFLAAEDDDDGRWIAEPFLPAGRQVALFARGKTGKSLLALDVAAALATGRPVLGAPARDPIDVVYVDMENPADDVRDRMLDLGYDVESELGRLHYFHLVDLPPLDTLEGGRAVEQIVRHYGAVVVIVDTTASTVEGEENSADTFRAFARHTGRRLRALGVALLRIDHGGKDKDKGQRGSSAKDDDVDVVLELAPTSSGRFVLRRLRARLSWVPELVTITREVEPLLRHVVEPVVLPDGVAEVVTLLDDLELPADVSVRAAMAAIREAVGGRKQDVVRVAVKLRRTRTGGRHEKDGNAP